MYNYNLKLLSFDIIHQLHRYNYFYRNLIFTNIFDPILIDNIAQYLACLEKHEFCIILKCSRLITK